MSITGSLKSSGLVAGEVVDKDRGACEQVDAVEAGRSIDDQRRERIVVDCHALTQLRVVVEADRGAGIDGQLAGRDQRAVVGRRLDRYLIERGVDVVQRGVRIGVEVIVRVGGASDAEGGGARVVQRLVGLRHEHERAGERVTKILPRIADDPQSVGGGVEVHAERNALERDGELVHLECLRRVRVDRVDASAIAEAV